MNLLLWILCGLSGSLLLVGALILFTPWHGALDFGQDRRGTAGIVTVDWVGQWLVYGAYDLTIREFRLFFWKRQLLPRPGKQQKKWENGGEKPSFSMDGQGEPSRHEPAAPQPVRPAREFPGREKEKGTGGTAGTGPEKTPPPRRERHVPPPPPPPPRDTQRAAEHEEGDRSGEDTRQAAPEEKKRGLLASLRRNRVLFFLRRRRLRRKALRWLGRVVRALFGILTVRSAAVRVKTGFEDPAATGVAYAWVHGATRLLQMRSDRGVCLEFVPVFDDAPGEITARAVISFSIGRLLAPVGVALLFFPYLEAFFSWRRMKREIG